MVKTLLLTLLLLSSTLSAGEFTASVRSRNVAEGKGFPLTLTLRDSSAKDSPNVTGLQRDFLIQSQQKSSSTIVTNGELSTTTSWKFTLIPSKTGPLTIPAIPIDTNEGVMWSKPIDIEVTEPKVKATPTGTKSRGDGFVVTTEASKTNPYKNEPITYNVKFTSETPFANVQMQRIVIDNAIVEMVNEPQVYNKVIRGEKKHILEFPLLITPLKPGTIVIPSAIIQGEVPAKESPRPRSFFDDGFNPFHMMTGLGRMEPFAIKTNETILNVQPPVPGVSPWLPVESLNIEEQWDEDQTMQVGEPLTRKIRISAVGIRAPQLPSLDSYVESNEDFKIYSDKPQTGENITQDSINSFRIEQYTIIPQKAGKLKLPEITIPWWDVKNDTKEYAKLPAKILDVAPSEFTRKTTTSAVDSAESTQPSQVVVSETHPLLYAVIAGLAILLLFAFIWVFSLQKKIGRLSESGEEREEVSTEKEQPKIRFKELSSVRTAKELHEFLQVYSHNKWATQKNATVSAICGVIRDHLPESYHENLGVIEKSLENALYRDIELNIKDISKQCSMILEKTRNNKDSIDKQEKLPELNPN